MKTLQEGPVPLPDLPTHLVIWCLALCWQHFLFNHYCTWHHQKGWLNVRQIQSPRATSVPRACEQPGAKIKVLS